VFSQVRRAVIAAVLTSSVAWPVFADTGSGSYLAGRQAVYQSDYVAAERYYSKALNFDPDNENLLESVLLSRIALGDIEGALPVAQIMDQGADPNQAGRMVIYANLVAQDKLDDLLARDPETQGVGPLVDGLMIAWAHMGKGAVSQAIEQFDAVATQEGLSEFALYHKAMALASIGDFEGAEAVMNDQNGAVSRISRRAALARAEILSQLDRNADALAFL